MNEVTVSKKIANESYFSVCRNAFKIKGIPEDPETLKTVENLRRELGRLTVEDLLKHFTI